MYVEGHPWRGWEREREYSRKREILGKCEWQPRNRRNTNMPPSPTCYKNSRPLPPLYHSHGHVRHFKQTIPRSNCCSRTLIITQLQIRGGIHIIFFLFLHNICFRGEIRKISTVFGWKKVHYLLLCIIHTVCHFINFDTSPGCTWSYCQSCKAVQGSPSLLCAPNTKQFVHITKTYLYNFTPLNPTFI